MSRHRDRLPDMSNLAPIVLFVYNRPEHTRRTLEALAANFLAAESDLIVYADGPKKPEHAESVRKVRDIVRGVSGFKSLKLIEREANLGLAKSIIAGVTAACDSRGKVIVLEDDLLVSQQFLTFLNRGLDCYESEERVFQVSGYMFPGCSTVTDTFFLPLTTTWGWATWQRAWRYFDPQLSGFDLIGSSAELRRRFNINGTYDYFSMAEQQRSGFIDSWGIRWYLSVFLRDGLTLFPSVSLVENIGVDGTGTHGAGHAMIQESMRISTQNHWQMPNSISIDERSLANVENVLRAIKPTGLRRLVGLARQKLSVGIRSIRERRT